MFKALGQMFYSTKVSTEVQKLFPFNTIDYIKREGLTEKVLDICEAGYKMRAPVVQSALFIAENVIQRNLEESK